MRYQFFPYLVPLLLSTALMLWLANYAWHRRRALGARAFAICAALDALWAFGNAMEIAAIDLPVKVFWANVQYFGFTMLPVAWFAMTLNYTGRAGLFSRRFFQGLLIVPLVTNILVWTNDLHHHVRTRVAIEYVGQVSVLVNTPGVWFWVHSLYSYTLLGIAVWMLTAALFGAYQAYKGQTLALLFGTLLPMIGSLAFVFDSAHADSLMRVDPAPVLSGVSGIIIGWALFRYGLFVVVPLAQERVVDGLADGVIAADIDGRIVTMNPAAEMLLGTTHQRAFRRNLTEVLTEGLARAVPDNSPGRVTLDIPSLGSGMRAGSDFTLEEGKTHRYIEARGSPLEDSLGQTVGRVVVLRDVTTLRSAAERFREAERRYRDLTELLPMPVFEMDETFRLTFANREMYACLGYDESDLARGFTTIDAIAPSDRERAEAAIRAIFAGETGQVQEYEYVRSDGSTFPAAVYSSPIVRNDRVVGIRGVIVDLTERKAQEAARDEQLSIISHDLRNPISVSAGHSEWLQRRLSERGLDLEAQSAEIATKSARQANAMILELVDSARLESGQMALHRAITDVGKFITDLVERVVPPAERPRVRADVVPLLWISMDPERIERALANLIGNAIRHSPPDTEVVVRASRQDGVVVVDVIDHGEGIDPKEQPHIFDRFYQSETRQQSGEGLGLGLYIARLIVEAHGGTISVASTPGEGTTFSFTLTE